MNLVGSEDQEITSKISSPSNLHPLWFLLQNQMNPPSLLMLFCHIIALLLSNSSSQPVSFSERRYDRYEDCAPILYECGTVKYNLTYPFRMDGRHDYCGYPGYYLDCTDDNTTLMIYVDDNGYRVKDVDSLNNYLTVVDRSIADQSCPQPFENATIDFSRFEYSDRDRNVTVFVNCSDVSTSLTLHDIGCELGAAAMRRSYYRLDGRDSGELWGKCESAVLVPMHQMAAEQLENGSLSFGEALKEGFFLRWKKGRGWCINCMNSGGWCGYNESSPNDSTCYCPVGPSLGHCGPFHRGRNNFMIRRIIIGVAVAGVFLAACVLGLLGFKSKEFKRPPSFAERQIQSFSNKDPELGSARCQTHVFPYKELLEATDYFDASKELGNGGFGSVYKGKLRDSRVVAVKRLHGNNYRRVEQFMNEVAILSGLHHQNLVALYGCTLRLSRELLLVYEFVPNGTVSDHLHGSRASEGALTWPLRLDIAIETADALAYLHAVEPQIIHRDVKTNNILLDGGFHVKVADFGLSRLFPTDATHVSTTPQGTPGYLDPEYQQYFQLTDKSDVYSFGVVLVELISSKPAVDVARRRHEISLANMAIDRIQNCELDQLVDLSLGYQSDWATKKMINMVAELAFRCLQSEGRMRPSIKEVLEVLREVKSRDYKDGKEEVAAARVPGDAGLLKNNSPFWPDLLHLSG